MVKERPSFEGFEALPSKATRTKISPSPAEKQRRTLAIRVANDTFRTTLSGGDIVTTPGINALGTEEGFAILSKIQSFTDFHHENDPWKEHDFGIIEHGGAKIYWKIDYYDEALEEGSPDPANPSCTRRVMTIMLNTEY